MCACMCEGVHTCMYTHPHTYMHTYIHVCVHAHLYVSMCVSESGNIASNAWNLWLWLLTRTHTHTLTRTHACTHTHTHAHMHKINGLSPLLWISISCSPIQAHLYVCKHVRVYNFSAGNIASKIFDCWLLTHAHTHTHHTPRTHSHSRTYTHNVPFLKFYAHS